MSGTYYARRDIIALDRAGNYYCRHVGAMTSENLHSKSDIAAELAHRDALIDDLREQVRKLESDRTELATALQTRFSRVELIDDTGRAYVKKGGALYRVLLHVQDSGRTLKVFLT